MRRQKKYRKISGKPACSCFGPHQKRKCESIIMELDEFEVIRLIDYEGLTQEQCAQQMEVARTTVQAIYAQARKKIAICLISGKKLLINDNLNTQCPKIKE